MARVVLQNLTKTYAPAKGPAVPVVRGIELTIEDREFMVLVGPSGCGKSTTLRLIAGLESVTQGEIVIGERAVTQVEPKDRDIAMVFQNYALYPHMTVFENMAFSLKMRGVAKEERRRQVEEAAEMLGLTPYLERKPKELSGGQRQRVAVGRAIVRKPKVFLFDEPLSNLDAKMRVATRTELVRLHRRLGATIVYVTHDQVEAMTMGDRICVMKDGRIMQVDTPLALYQRPANVFVAGFIGSPPMNLWSGRIVTEGRALRFCGEGGVTLNWPKEWAGPERIVVGVRPEHLRLGTVPEGALSFSAQVERTELMGAETWVHLQAGAVSLVARSAPECRWTVGAEVSVGFSPTHLHVFDALTEQALAFTPLAAAR